MQTDTPFTTQTPFDQSAQVLRLARDTGLSAPQVRAILVAPEFARPNTALAADLAEVAARVGCTPAQVAAVLDAA